MVTGIVVADPNSKYSHDQPETGTDSVGPVGIRAHETIVMERDIEALVLPWTLRTIRTGTFLAIGFEWACLAADTSRISAHHPFILACHLLSLAAEILVIALTWTRWFKRHWRSASTAVCITIIGASSAIALASGSMQALFMTAILMTIGAASILPWSSRWQAVVTASSGAATVGCSMILPVSDIHAPYYWMALVVAAGFAHLATTLGERYRRALYERIEALEENHRRSLDHIAEREAMVAERERAQRELHESEVTLRKILEASPDAMAISRFDGAYIESNAIFGYSRGEIVASNALKLGVWADPREREEYVRRLKAEGGRPQHGGNVLRPQRSAEAAASFRNVVELHGERVIVSIAAISASSSRRANNCSPLRKSCQPRSVRCGKPRNNSEPRSRSASA